MQQEQDVILQTTLYCQKQGAIEAVENSQPCLVWLHGFLGSSEEWQAIVPHFAEYPNLLVDLPGHGQSSSIRVRSMAQVNQLLINTLKQQGIEHYWLIGYSMGGRIACFHATQFAKPSGLCGLIVEGAHPGLAQEEQCLGRWYHDNRWAERFRRQPLVNVLDEWYRQPVFADLSADMRSAMIAARSQNDPCNLAMMLEGTSLARQPQMSHALQHLSIPFMYLAGSKDVKFQRIAQQYGFPLTVITDAGHNTHRANAAEFIAQVRHKLNIAH
ncbi:MAG: 2-succinyl-6-hydroxy-2,4-cyclohexadiene-1-carboxylate synthase [Plesiomonas sp.]|uniref:2-succinyl-6-hydroxy-2, 4-cyclohexadiene-1-carboxylate synthase n=1 Tax=Plesiomonas sp. TaxID=2486279 RepID=UPI003F3929DD